MRVHVSLLLACLVCLSHGFRQGLPTFSCRHRRCVASVMPAQHRPPRTAGLLLQLDGPAPVERPKPAPRGNASVEESVRFLLAAVLIGILTGLAITVFKTSIAEVAAACYNGDEVVMPMARRMGLGGAAVFIPAGGGLIVGLLRLASPRAQLGPGLAEHVAEVERAVPCKPIGSVKRSAAAVATLGTGNSLGPEGPSVEVGLSISRLVADALNDVETQLRNNITVSTPTDGPNAQGVPASSRFPWRYDDGLADGGDDADGLALRRHRQLIAAGAAAGVAAGFNAPLAGVFFSLEVVSEAVRSAVVPPKELELAAKRGESEATVDLSALRDSAELDVKSKEAISAIVIAALVSALVIQTTLGQELALQPGVFGVTNRLIELPLYVGLGALAGGVALAFQVASSASRNFFQGIAAPLPTSDGSDSPDDDRLGIVLRPVLGGLACGLIGVAYPQVLFFGYSTLDAILATGEGPAAGDYSTINAILDAGAGDSVVATQLSSVASLNLLDLLFAKLLATAICVGSGLVGGTFAPSLFFGAALGVAYQSFAGTLLCSLADAIAAYQTSIGVEVGSWGVIPQLTVADAPAYAMIGAAAVLSSVFRAPLTASLLLFELTRAYDIVLPLLAATGTGPLVVEFVRKRQVAGLAGGSGSSRLPTIPVLRAPAEDACEVPPEETTVTAAAVCEEDEVVGVVVPDACDVDNAILCESVDEDAVEPKVADRS